MLILPSPKAISMGAFVDQHESGFTNAELRGKWSIVFFGYTHCPDICPTTMHTLGEVKKNLMAEKSWGNYQVIMVTVDPARDRPSHLRDYVSFFDSEFTGISSNLKTTTEFAKQLGILFVAQAANDNGAYEVDHSTALILLNPAGKMAGLISAPHTISDISHDLIALADYYSEDHKLQVADTREENNTHSQELPITKAQEKLDINATLRIENAWIRPSPKVATAMAGYFNLRNIGESDITLVAVESPQFSNSMIHTTVMEDGVAKMRHLSKLLVPAGGETLLQPKGIHIMLMQPKTALSRGEAAELTLIADNGQRFSTSIQVRDKPQKAE
jgi:protein SCO1/2